jgi:rhodanese-related sulfurtransferase
MSPIQDLTPTDVAEGLANGTMLVIDVREPHELIMARIPGEVLNLPLSSFDPAAIPDPGTKRVVFTCAAGMRSQRAVELAQGHGLPYDSHLAGGLKAWAMAGFDIERG